MLPVRAPKNPLRSVNDRAYYSDPLPASPFGIHTHLSNDIMSRSPLHRALARIAALAEYSDRHGITSQDAIDRAEENCARAGLDRRTFLAGAGSAAVIGAVSAMTPRALRAAARGRDATVDVAIVGAGMAGLACADRLQSAGIVATVYDASDRVGGRVWSLGSLFPGQVAERGGEFIDTTHTTMRDYARRFGLELENVETLAGDVLYYFGGRHYSEAAVVDEYRAFVDVMRDDLRSLSAEVTYDAHTPFDVELDRTSLEDYLDGRNGARVAAGPIAREAIRQAYIAEYGLEPDEQSCLNFLLFIHADRRSKFTPFGVFSDERFHVIGGNDQIPRTIAASLAKDIEHGMQLIAIRRTSGGRAELTFRDGHRTVTRTHDAVVLAIPFTVLRTVELDASLAIPLAQRNAIATLGYGMNAKMMVGFDGRPWRALDGNGTSYADLANCQTTWETNPANAGATRSIITDYSGGDRGRRLDPSKLQTEADRFVKDFDKVVPGALSSATRVAGAYRAHLEHWPSNPLTRGSYTCYLPGQFTGIAGLEGRSVGNIFFAGEHVNSFYEWQGFMEGAALSGVDAAKQILAAVKVGALQ
jgi:monoamine oxidase